MKGIVKKVFALSGIGMIAVMSPQLYASGYKLEFQSASVLADAGDAAVIEDASTNWYNSAGLVYLPQQAVFTAYDVYSHSSFKGTSTAPNVVGGPSFSGTGTATSHPNTVLPAISYALPFKDRYAFGITITPAWGLSHDYGDTSVARYDLTRISTRSLDIAPSFAVKVNEQWSLGVGPDFHYFTITSKNHVRTQGLTVDDSVARSTANSWNYGGHAGILFRLTEATRFGLNYRSQIVQNMDGYSSFAIGRTGPTFTTNDFELRMVMPATTSLSGYHDINNRWAVMGTLAYDQWSSFRNLNAHNYMVGPGTTANIIQPEKMHDTLDVGAGVHYIVNDQFMLRGSAKYLPTPTNNTYRDINFPDGAKFGLNVGAHYQAYKKVGLDVIVAHVWSDQANINFTNATSGVVTNGKVNTSIDIVGAQIVWDI